MQSLPAQIPHQIDGNSISPLETPTADYRLGEGFENLQHASIMMVDDEPITMEVVQTFLEDAGYREFLLVEDSTQAIQQLEQHRPDVLLLDVMMPEVSGFDILRQLRDNDEFAHLPVIILTSSSDAETKLTALDLGATDFLSKPVDPSELALRVRNTLAAKAYQDQLTYYDALTNLPNIHLFNDRTEWAIQRAKREQLKSVLLHISFPDFRKVTDTLGPEVGDEVIKQLAERLSEQLRSSDVISRGSAGGTPWTDLFRVGTADFSILLPAVEDFSIANVVGQRIIDVMQPLLLAHGNEITLQPSIGVSGFPEDATDTMSLIKCAMHASSQAREMGNKGLQYYSAELNQASLHRYRMEADLHGAIANQEFKLLYQPKVCVKSGQITGAEALIRWQRSDGSIVSPLDFIPIAEDSGLILPIGEWVLRTACAQIAEWHRAGHRCKVAVNISARQLFETDLVALLESAIQSNAIAPQYLTLEITESLLIDDIERAVEILASIRALGCSVSMDDFGTGYSSLSYLKRFPLDEVKIDRAFIIEAVSSPKDQALIKAITYLGHEFGFQICAEGVEEPEQLELLKQAGCDEYQGYYFSRPIEAGEFTEKLIQG